MPKTKPTCERFVLQDRSVALDDLNTCATCGKPEREHAREPPQSIEEAAGHLAADYRLSGAYPGQVLAVGILHRESAPSIGVHVRDPQVQVAEVATGFAGYPVVRCCKGQRLEG